MDGRKRASGAGVTASAIILFTLVRGPGYCTATYAMPKGRTECLP
ncbi:hypothetical protein [Sphingopyxis terrae]